MRRQPGSVILEITISNNNSIASVFESSLCISKNWSSGIITVPKISSIRSPTTCAIWCQNGTNYQLYLLTATNRIPPKVCAAGGFAFQAASKVMVQVMGGGLRFRLILRV